MLVCLTQGNALKCAQDCRQRKAVRNNQYTSLRVADGYLIQCCSNALIDLAHGLAAGRSYADRVCLTRKPQTCIAFTDLFDLHALPLTLVDLAQSWIDVDRKTFMYR